MAPEVAAWSAKLAASPLQPTLDHNHLHPFNALADGTVFYDWGDSVVAHPLAADLAPHAELVETLELACRVAKIARALVWDRALLAAREQGEPVDPRFADAAMQTLASIRDAPYLLL